MVTARSLMAQAAVTVLLAALPTKGLAQCYGEKLSDDQKIQVLKKLDRNDRQAVKCAFELMDNLGRQGDARIIPLLVENLDLKRTFDQPIIFDRYGAYPAMDELLGFGEKAEPSLVSALAHAAPDSIFSQNAIKALMVIERTYPPAGIRVLFYRAGFEQGAAFENLMSAARAAVSFCGPRTQECRNALNNGLLLFTKMGYPGRTPQLNLDAPYDVVHTESRPCDNDDWAYLSQPFVQGVLFDYGYTLAPGLQCIRAVVPWLSDAKIIRILDSQGRDNYGEVTVALESASTQRVWTIPIKFGKAAYPNTPDNPHNVAAFNDLLAHALRKPDYNLLFEMGSLYQFMVGMEEWSDPTRSPQTIRDALEINDVTGLIGTKPDPNGGITLKHQEPDGDARTHAHLVWKFHFGQTYDGLRLSSVERGPLDPKTDN
jgi:hypothetical protein